MSARVLTKALTVLATLLLVLHFGGQRSRDVSSWQLRAPGAQAWLSDANNATTTAATLPSNATCGDVHLVDDQCAFVQSEVCADETQLLNYLYFHYCALGHVRPLSYVLLFGWLVVLLYMLGTTAEDHFCALVYAFFRLHTLLAAVDGENSPHSH